MPAEEVKETLERAQARAREELDMISDLLEFGKLKEIKPKETPEPLQHGSGVALGVVGAGCQRGREGT